MKKLLAAVIAGLFAVSGAAIAADAAKKDEKKPAADAKKDTKAGDAKKDEKKDAKK